MGGGEGEGMEVTHAYVEPVHVNTCTKAVAAGSHS